MSDGAWKQVRADWRDVVLVCRKCSRKLDGGFGPGGDQRFAKALRGALGGGRKGKALRRAVAVVEVGCLDVCPKRAVVVVRGSAPGRLVLVPEGAPMAEVAARLGLQAGREAADAAGRPAAVPARSPDRDAPSRPNRAGGQVPDGFA